MNNQHETSTRQRHRALPIKVRVGGLFAAGAIVLAACGGGGGTTATNDMAGMNMGGNAAGNVAAATKAVASNAVKITNFAFSPATVTVKAGSTVVWTNDDSIQHDVTFNGGGISSGVMNHNDTFSHTFPTPGTYHYICSIHPFMHGTVIVTG